MFFPGFERLLSLNLTSTVPQVRIGALKRSSNKSMRPTPDELMTVGELREQLQGLPDDAKIFFGCESLAFFRIKKRGDNYYQIEFNQTVGDNEKGEVFVSNHLPQE